MASHTKNLETGEPARGAAASQEERAFKEKRLFEERLANHRSELRRFDTMFKVKAAGLCARSGSLTEEQFRQEATLIANELEALGAPSLQHMVVTLVMEMKLFRKLKLKSQADKIKKRRDALLRRKLAMRGL